MKPKIIQGLIFSALFCLISCGQKDTEYQLKQFQGMSLLGDSLKILSRSEQQLAPLTTNLEEAQANFEVEPSEMNTIWLGRRYAYLSDYQKAIEVFSVGLEKYPESYKLYRHRGHRYISLRQFDKAIIDFQKAYELMPKNQMDIEPDGAPNKLNIPLSNTQFNILYHYGLAHYLKGEFGKAEEIYTELLRGYCDNQDLIVATADWLYMSLKRQGKDELAAEVLDLIYPEMEIIENDSYLKRLMMYKGELPVEELFKTDNDDVALSLATQGYGVANWYLYNGDTVRAKEIFDQVLGGTSWAAFGYIAAEADMKRLQ
ncbi:MAG: tetratricopeptide repeat protein [Cytophagia bacterium]|nr:tetratricopeptide repeat protein [Cytophagia bacterium]